MDDFGYRQRAIGDLFNSIVRRLGFAGWNRYMGEFPYPHPVSQTVQLRETVAFDDWQIRDRIAAGVREVFLARKFEDIRLSTEDDNRGPYAFSFNITVEGRGKTIPNILQAYQRMEETLKILNDDLEKKGLKDPGPAAKPGL